uniref:Chemokine interleukin-8-like domain-containing protein n=1 Tax=Myripristis murdjan TaxID=586833 RepID=A0A667Y833_9TELE
MSYFKSYAVNRSPTECCFKFYTGKILKKQIIDVKKTYTNCAESAFVYVCASASHLENHLTLFQ